MTQDEIIEMARQAGIDHHKLWNDDGTNNLEAFAKLVEAHTRGQMFKPDWDNYRQGLIDGAVSEREACAKVCEDSIEYAGDELARQIRAKGKA